MTCQQELSHLAAGLSLLPFLCLVAHPTWSHPTLVPELLL